MKAIPLTYDAVSDEAFHANLPFLDAHFSQMEEFSITEDNIQRFRKEFCALLANLQDIRNTKRALHSRLLARSMDSWKESSDI